MTKQIFCFIILAAWKGRICLNLIDVYDRCDGLCRKENASSISLTKGEELLRSLKSSVMDFFSVTSLHFLNLGEEGVLHFVFLLNAIISHINSSSVAELNTVWANILFKGGHTGPFPAAPSLPRL